ncbi:DMT family transporter [Nonomuraea sp. NPDC002799]
MLLLFVSAAWGSAFPLMKDLITRLPVEDLLAERYLIAALTLLCIRPGCLRGLPRDTWIHGTALGVMFGVGQVAQAVALHSLPSAVSGFAVGCSVVITPILTLILFKAKVRRRIWAGVALALAGMTVFTLLRGVEEHELSVLALVATLFAAALYSGHTLLLAHLTKRAGGFRAYSLTAIQLFTIGLLCGGFAVRDGITLPGAPADWAILAHLSVVSCALGFLARSYGQQHVPAVPSQILMSTQPVWVTAIAVIWFDEQVGWSMAAGGGLMVGAMLLALPPRKAALGKERRRRNGELLVIAEQAASALAGLKIKPEDPVPSRAGAAPYLDKDACGNTERCSWHTGSLKGDGEPSLERLIARASAIVRAQNPPGPGCCRSVTLLGRCLCDLMEESEQARMQALRRWLRHP